MLSFTTGSHETMFSSNGINGDMNVTLWPIQVRTSSPPFLLSQLLHQPKLCCVPNGTTLLPKGTSE